MMDDCPMKVGQCVKFVGDMHIGHEGTIPDGATATYRGRSGDSENYYLFELDEDHGFLFEGYEVPNVFLGDGFCFGEERPEVVAIKLTWDEVKLGDTVYIDNYQDGKFPKANPRIGGPFEVVKGNGCGRCLKTQSGKTFMHYPNNLLKGKP